MMPGITKIKLQHFYLVFILLTIATSVQVIIASVGQAFPRYGNYIIFSQSFEHLLGNLNLYEAYPGIQNDLYKYSPAFSVLMAPFYYLPKWLGFTCFQLLNTGIFLLGIRKIVPDTKQQQFVLIYLLLEVGKALTYCQTNLLITGLLLLAFYSLEKGKIIWATLFITLTVYIKIFGILAYALWLFYPKKSAFIKYTILWNLVFLIMPLLLISPDQLIWQYQNWFTLLRSDHDGSIGISFAGWLQNLLRLNISKNAVLITGILLFCLSLSKISSYKSELYRKLMISSILIWVVIFNHKGESATYIIALTGAAIWYFSQPANLINKILLWIGFLSTTAAGIDLITPGWIIREYVTPYSIEAIGCSLIWLKLVYDQLFTIHHSSSLKPSDP